MPVGNSAGVTHSFDPFRVGAVRVPFSGGVAPGYLIDPLRGSEIGVVLTSFSAASSAPLT